MDEAPFDASNAPSLTQIGPRFGIELIVARRSISSSRYGKARRSAMGTMRELLFEPLWHAQRERERERSPWWLE